MPIVAPMIQFLSAGALLTGLVCVSWARRSHARASKFEMRARQARERAEATLRVYEALLNHGNQGIVVLNPPGEGRQYFAQGREMFEACIDHPESGRAVRAFDALVAKGTACSFRLPTPEGGLAVRGLPLAGRAVLYLQEEAIPAKSDRGHQIPEALPLAAVAAGITETIMRADPAAQEDIFDRVPLAMAVFDAEQKLVRYNTAYAQLWGLANVWLDSHPSYGDVLARLREQRKLPEQRNFGDWKQTQI